MAQATKEHCEQVVAKLREKYIDLGDYVLIQPAEHWVDYDNGQMYVCWEEGPYEWTMDIDFKIPGLFLEPYNTFVLSVIVEDDDEETDDDGTYRSEYMNGGQW